MILWVWLDIPQGGNNRPGGWSRERLRSMGTAYPQFPDIHPLRLWERKKAMLEAAPWMNLLEGSKLEECFFCPLVYHINSVSRRKLGEELENHCYRKWNKIKKKKRKKKERKGWLIRGIPETEESLGISTIHSHHWKLLTCLNFWVSMDTVSTGVLELSIMC